ncbi:HNH endonuclease [Clostridium sp. OS1-26]|uniref:HNH endonuclease n=1 Tax=Clostridium sp. OS1-26 TaxID=3070681 RepID=UPI0027E108D2|nr:HNH endonuclease [Clostridium sp. OS1-26]WML33908.1 HNH endonuclease [Clostridium sp. OS1-26]
MVASKANNVVTSIKNSAQDLVDRSANKFNEVTTKIDNKVDDLLRAGAAKADDGLNAINQARYNVRKALGLEKEYAIAGGGNFSSPPEETSFFKNQISKMTGNSGDKSKFYKGYRGNNEFDKVDYDAVVATGRDKSGKVVAKWVIPKGYESVDDFLSKVDDTTIENYGYKNLDEFRNAVENVNESPSNTIINQSLAGNAYTNGLEYDILGFPIFKGDNLKFELNLPNNSIKASDPEQFTACTKELERAIIDGTIPESMFTSNQLQDIIDGMPRIEGLTWHHHQVTGKMQLVNAKIHQANHLEGNIMWGGGIR